MRQALLDSVRAHLVADVPVGVFLSGGIDSGALVGLMRDAGQHDIQAVTLAFGEFRGWELGQLLATDVVAEGVRRLAPLRLIGHAIEPRPRSAHAKVAALEASLSCWAIPTGRAWPMGSRCACRWSMTSCSARSRLWRARAGGLRQCRHHGVDAWQRRSAANHRALLSAALVTSVSRYTRAQLLSWADIPPSRVRVLPNTLLAIYGPLPKRGDLIARLGLAGRRIILTVGRLSALERYRGHDRLIAALPAITARVPAAAYLIVGSGDDQPRIERLAHEAGVGDLVLFAGHVPDPELPDYFALAHVFAMPSTGERFGIASLEAAASSLPVIGGNCDGSVGALADGQIGRLVNPHAPAEVEGAVIDALSGHHPVPAGTEATRRFAFARFAARVDALVGTLVR